MHYSPFLLFIFIIFFSSCSTPTKKTKSYNMALADSFQELEESLRGREIASKDGNLFLKEVLPIFRVLNKDFDVLVFPKKGIHQTSSKYSMEGSWMAYEEEFIKKWGKVQGKKKFKEFLRSTVSYRTPKRFRFSDISLGSCYQMVLQNKSPWFPRSFFGSPQKYNYNRSKKCLILRVREVGKRKQSNKRESPIQETVLYLDQYLKSYGINQLIKGRKETRWVASQSEEISPLSSESTYFPIDIPNFFDFLTRKNWRRVSQNALDIPQDAYVKDSLKKYMKNKTCSGGFSTSFLDPIRNPVRVGWCQNHYWPTTIHTDHYFSILIQGAQGR